MQLGRFESARPLWSCITALRSARTLKSKVGDANCSPARSARSSLMAFARSLWQTRPRTSPRHRVCPNARPLQSAVFVHPIAHVQDELRRCARDAFAMGHVVERAASARDARRCTRGFRRCVLPVDFRHCSNSVLAFTLASPSAICTRLWALTSPSPEVSIGQEDHVLEFVDHRRLHSVRLRRWHAAERLQRQHHVAEMMDGVVHVLADLEMALAAARELVVERMRHLGQLVLRHQVVRDAAEMLDGAVIEDVPHPLADADAPSASCAIPDRWRDAFSAPTIADCGADDSPATWPWHAPSPGTSGTRPRLRSARPAPARLRARGIRTCGSCRRLR